MLHLPMEPFGYPAEDPGPRTLLASAGEQDNHESLQWHLSRFSGYTGVVNYLGAPPVERGSRPCSCSSRARGHAGWYFSTMAPRREAALPRSPPASICPSGRPMSFSTPAAHFATSPTDLQAARGDRQIRPHRDRHRYRTSRHDRCDCGVGKGFGSERHSARSGKRRFPRAAG